MKTLKSNREKWLHVRLSEMELNDLKRRFEKTTCRKLSDFARRLLLREKITVYTRNGSLDAFLAEMIMLRKQLQILVESYQQRIEQLKHFQSPTDQRLLLYVQDANQQRCLKHVEEINTYITKMWKQWSQE